MSTTRPSSTSPPSADDAPLFADILLGGPCNLRCPYCIGRMSAIIPDSSALDTWPLPGLDGFVSALRARRISEVTVSGLSTDPHCYRHEARLVATLRQTIPGARLSIHTNGQRSLEHLEVLASYDRATISVPSLDPATYTTLTGGGRLLDLPSLVSRASIPLKTSTVVLRENHREILSMLGRLGALGITRATLRRPVGHDEVPFRTIAAALAARWPLVGSFGGAPVHDIEGLEVTLWDFEAVTTRCLHLLPDGTITDRYLLTPG